MSRPQPLPAPRFERRGKAVGLSPDSLPPTPQFLKRGESKAGHQPELPRPAGPEARRETRR